LRDPKYFFMYLIQYWNPHYVPAVQFMDTATVANLVRQGKSLIRLGDGEIYLLNHGDIPFEKSTPRLREQYRKAITSYTTDSSYILALNRVPLRTPNRTLREKDLLTCWLPSKVYYELYFNHGAPYTDAAMFYFKETIPEYFEGYLRTKQIVFVSNATICATFKENKKIPFELVSVVVTPETNAFAEYDRIKAEVMTHVEKMGRDKVVVLAAFGPASKVLAYEFSQIGIQVLDVGQGISTAYTGNDHSLSKNIRELQ